MIICARCGAAVGNIVLHYEVQGGVPKARVRNYEVTVDHPPRRKPPILRVPNPDRFVSKEQQRLEHNRKAVAEWRERLEREAVCVPTQIANSEVRMRGLQE